MPYRVTIYVACRITKHECWVMYLHGEQLGIHSVLRYFPWLLTCYIKILMTVTLL